jgi:hypothetical protein
MKLQRLLNLQRAAAAYLAAHPEIATHENLILLLSVGSRGLDENRANELYARFRERDITLPPNCVVWLSELASLVKRRLYIRDHGLEPGVHVKYPDAPHVYCIQSIGSDYTLRFVGKRGGYNPTLLEKA